MICWIGLVILFGFIVVIVLFSLCLFCFCGGKGYVFTVLWAALLSFLVYLLLYILRCVVCCVFWLVGLKRLVVLLFFNGVW